MSWLNNSLNTIKGQLTTLAQEVLAETAGPGDAEYREEPEIDKRTALQLLADTAKEKEELDKLCSEKESEIVILRKQIVELQSKISDSGGGNHPTAAAVGGYTVSGSGRTSKSPSDNNNLLEDSWCWEPDNAKSDNDRGSETSSGNGNEMVNISLEEVSLVATAKTTKRPQRPPSENADHLHKRIQYLEDENKQLNAALEELDSQHNLAMQNVLELKGELQEKLTAVTKDYESLKKEHADKFINGELELGKVRSQFELLDKKYKTIEAENQTMLKKIDDYSDELKRAADELADFQMLLEKKNQDNLELIERVKIATVESEKAEEERVSLSIKMEQIMKEMENVEKVKEKKTSESSTSSLGKQSEDEFIVVRETDANSSGPTTPPSKEVLKDKLVQLENRVSELTLENGSLKIKLQDREMEKELSANVMKENLQMLLNKNDQQDEEIKISKQQLEEQQEKIDNLKEKAAEVVIGQEKIKYLTEEKKKMETEIGNMMEKFKVMVELEKRLLFSEQEKENLQVELEKLRTVQDRVVELEAKIQKVTIENQEFKLNAEAEAELLNNSSELEDRIRSLSEENNNLRSELDSIAHAKFRQAIAEAKQEITDLDADEEESLNLEKVYDLLNTCMKQKGNDESTDKLLKSLREKLLKVENLEKSLAQTSEKIVDLQNSKLLWNHEKKTLEADISQYILQCDELMKNNEILLNELENLKRNKLETIPENNEENVLQLESQLEECTKLNRTLEEEHADLYEEIDVLEKEKKELRENLNEAQQSIERITIKQKDLELQVETMELEKCNLIFELNELKSADKTESIVDDTLKEAQDKYLNIEGQLTRLSKDHADLVAALQSQKTALMESNKKRQHSEQALSDQEMLMQKAKEEIAQLRNQLQKMEELSNKLKTMEEQYIEVKEELQAKIIVEGSLKVEKKKLQEQLAELSKSQQTTNSLEHQLLANQETITNLHRELEEKFTKEHNLFELKEKERLDELNSIQDAKRSLENDYEKLKRLYESQGVELKSAQEALQSTTTTANNNNELLMRIAKLETDLLATADLQKSVETLNYEKSEMIKALQQKHSENMQYYMEIQRLQPIVQQLQQQLTTAGNQQCEKCPALETTISDFKKEHEKLQDQITFLKEKSDILTTNLLTEQTNQKLVQQEKMEVEEQNAAIRKDLERLREHLLEVEDMHTQETVHTQRELDETKAKMLSLEEEVSKSSNAYTSASIRANQHAETLQAQHVLVVQQRDELVNKLSLAEDRESKNQAALCNLQCALEQFQNDKENDIKAATHRIRKELQLEHEKTLQLQNEIAGLNQQLVEAKQGLLAATRLSDQLEACQQVVATLREEVDGLQQQNRTLETKLSATESSQSDKIDKSLIKSLLIGYVVSGNPNDKAQVLRMISSVLSFTPTESDKVGLNKQPTSWFGTILGGGAGGGNAAQGTHSKDNLVQAFVQFLEQESQPKMNPDNMPNLLNITQNTVGSSPPAAGVSHGPSSRRASISSNSSASGVTPTPIPIQPLLLNSNVLDDFAPTRNSSSILKDILNDS